MERLPPSSRSCYCAYPPTATGEPPMPSAHLRQGIQERPATCTNSASVTLERSTTPLLPSAGSKARSDTSPHRDTLPWIATPASFPSISSSVSARRSPLTNARPRGWSQVARREEPLLPYALGHPSGKDIPPMGLDHALQGILDPGCSLFGVSAEEQGSCLETPGHGRVQEAQVPQRHPTSIEIHDGLPKVFGIPEEGRYRHVATRTPRREPRSDHQPHAAPGPDEVP